MGQILLVRHAQASFGSADYDRLSALGVEQARLLGSWIASRGRRIDLTVTGNLKRHRQTADACIEVLPAALKPAAAAHSEAGFDEYDADEILLRHRPDFADPALLQRHLEEGGNPRRAFHDLFFAAMRRWMQGAHDAEYRESWNAFRSRCVAALNRVVEQAGPSRTSLVFTSGPARLRCQRVAGQWCRDGASLPTRQDQRQLSKQFWVSRADGRRRGDHLSVTRFKRARTGAVA